MSEYSPPKRRDFLKTAAVGAAGAMGLSALKFERVFAQSSTGSAWVNGMQINPAIDNKRVVCCHDPKMLNNLPTSTSFSAQNAAVNATVVNANMDEMAMQLAQKATAAEAWSTIFRTGASKTWATTKVAIKTNGITPNNSSVNRVRVAIIKKIADVMVGFGVLPTNIILYDACDDPTPNYGTYVSASDATKIRAVVSARGASLGGLTPVTLVNWASGQGTCSCPADLVNGVVDILVDIAVCKMHDGTGGRYSYGSCTLCMKNHFGTFTDSTKSGHSDGLHVSAGSVSGGKNPDALFEINKHSAILGGNPVRQQLCIVDALLSNGTSGPGGPYDNRTDRIVMGTLAPMVDYLTANKILLNSAVMTSAQIPAAGQTAAATVLPQFLTSFGYTATDPNWLEYEASNPPAITAGTGGSGGSTGAGGSTGSTSAGGSTGSNSTTGAGGKGGSKAGGGSTTSNGGSTASNGGSTASNGGSTASNGGSTANNGGTIATGGADNGGTTAAGGAMGNGGTTFSGGSAGATGGAATSAPSETGGSPAAGGTSAESSTRANPTGGQTGTAETTGTTHGTSGGGCDIAGGDRSATRWGAMLAFGTVLAAKLRHLVSDDDKS